MSEATEPQEQSLQARVFLGYGKQFQSGNLNMLVLGLQKSGGSGLGPFPLVMVLVLVMFLCL